jgi:hypothetical protein
MCSEEVPGYIEHARVRFILDYTVEGSPLVTLQQGTHVLTNMDRDIVEGDQVISQEVYLGVGQVEAVLEV